MVVQGLAERREGGAHFDTYVQIITHSNSLSEIREDGIETVKSAQA
jgi:hypothetical protein